MAFFLVCRLSRITLFSSLASLVLGTTISACTCVHLGDYFSSVSYGVQWEVCLYYAESARGRGQSSHERWGRGGKRWKSGGQNKRRPRINAALEKAPHFREAEINSRAAATDRGNTVYSQ